MLVVKAEFAVDVLFLIFECDGRSPLSFDEIKKGRVLQKESIKLAP